MKRLLKESPAYEIQDWTLSPAFLKSKFAYLWAKVCLFCRFWSLFWSCDIISSSFGFLILISMLDTDPFDWLAVRVAPCFRILNLRIGFYKKTQVAHWVDPVGGHDPDGSHSQHKSDFEIQVGQRWDSPGLCDPQRFPFHEMSTAVGIWGGCNESAGSEGTYDINKWHQQNARQRIQGLD